MNAFHHILLFYNWNGRIQLTLENQKLQSGVDKIRYLDGLRGVAALAVVLAHILTGFYPTLYSGDPRQAHNFWEVWTAGSPFNMVAIGNCFVCIFFMLSGYVLTYSVLSKQRQNQFVALAIGRYIRLTLPIFASSFFAYLILKSALVAHVQAAATTNSYWWLATLYQFTPSFTDMAVESIYGVYQYSVNYNPALWTMRIELLGSFMVFGILMVCRPVRLRMVAYLIISLFFFSPYYFCFIVGMFFYDIRERTQQPPSLDRAANKKTSTAITALLIVFGVFLGAYPYAYTNGTWYEGIATLLLLKLDGEDTIIIAHLVAAVMLLLAVERSISIRKILCGTFLQFIGRNAFSIYLLHLILLVSVMSGSYKWLSSKLPYDVAVFVAAIIFISLLLIISNAMFYFIDRPSVRLSHRVGRAIEAIQTQVLRAISLKWKSAN
ncbi:MAG: acyltransferase family protein [Burkholderiaceae bacterium]